MDKHQTMKIALGASIGGFVVILVLIVVMCCYCKRCLKSIEELENGKIERGGEEEEDEERRGGRGGEEEEEELVGFEGGEEMTIGDILDAPGEVVGKSSYGTLYMAVLERRKREREEVVLLLRFLRPACTDSSPEVFPAIRMLGLVRHANLVPLLGFYKGTRGEKLLVHPFFHGGTLSHFLRGARDEKHRWPIIYKISLGIAQGLDYLHMGLQKPIIHGNLKSKNILLDSNFHPYLSDFGLHLILHPTVAQEMLEASADQGYKAPELMKMKDASTESDIYSLGVIFLEILTKKEPVCRTSSSPLDVYLPTSMRNAALNHKAMDMFDLELLSQINRQNSITEDGLLMYFHLAMSCCSPSPALRPNTKQIVRKLEEIGHC